MLAQQLAQPEPAEIPLHGAGVSSFPGGPADGDAVEITVTGEARNTDGDAEVDGAGWWHSFINVTLPSLRPITLFVVVISVIESLQLFDLPFVLLDGEGPGGHGRTIVMYLFQKFETAELGLACATGWALAVLIFLVTLVQLHLMNAFQQEK